MENAMNSTPYQYSKYTPAEFEQFRAALQQDGFVITQNTIDEVSGHIGSLTYLSGMYNRVQQVLTVTVKTSPWQNFTDADVERNLARIVQRDKVTDSPVNQKTMSTPATSSGTGVTMPPKAAVTTAAASAPSKASTAPAPAQTSKPAQTDPSEKTSEAAQSSEPAKDKEEPAKKDEKAAATDSKKS
jgi:hypothetical protein